MSKSEILSSKKLTISKYEIATTATVFLHFSYLHSGSLSETEKSSELTGKETDFLVRIQKQDGDQKQQIAMIEKVKSVTNKDYNVRRSEFVGPVVG